jgi:hypothetical protein
MMSSYSIDPSNVGYDVAAGLRALLSGLTEGDSVSVASGVYPFQSSVHVGPQLTCVTVPAGVSLICAPGAVFRPVLAGGPTIVNTIALAAGARLIGGTLDLSVASAMTFGVRMQGRRAYAERVVVEDAPRDGFYLTADDAMALGCEARRAGRSGFTIALGAGVAIDDCYAEKITGDPGSGFHVEPDAETSVDYPRIERSEARVCQKGISVHGVDVLRPSICDNRVYDSVGNNIQLLTGASPVVARNISERAGGYGLAVNHPCVDAIAEENRLTDCGLGGFNLVRNAGDGASGLFLRRNFFSGGPKGAQMSEPSGTTCSGNVFTDIAGPAFALVGTPGGGAGNNIFANNAGNVVNCQSFLSNTGDVPVTLVNGG